MTQKAIGPNFSNELAAAGLSGLPFSWDALGNLYFMPAMTSAQTAAVEAVYAAHNPETPCAQDTAQAMLSAGLTIASTSTPAINGVYATDAAAQTRIATMMLGIQVNGTFPGGNSAYPYPDASGAFHTFPNIATFKAFASAVDNFVAQLVLYAAEAPEATLPPASVTIA